MAKKINIPEETLQRMYLDERMSSIKIAKALGVSKSAILVKLKEFGISARSISEARLPEGVKYPSKEELKAMYEVDRLTQVEIAGRLGVSDSTVGNLFVKYSIPTRERSEAQRKINSLEVITEKENFEQMYLQEGMPISEIAKELGLSPSATHVRITRHGIPMRDQTENAKYSEEEKAQLQELYIERSLSTSKIAEELDMGIDAVAYGLKKYGIQMRNSSECHMGQEFSDEARAKMSESKKGEKNARYGEALAREHIMKLIESKRDYPGKTNYLLGGHKFDSRDEAAVATLFEKYIHNYQVQEGETFQANKDTTCLYDFVLPGAIVEWHPIQIRFDASEEDRGAHRELRSELKTKQDRNDYNRLVDDHKEELAVEYWMRRQEASDNSQFYQGKEVVLARDFNELYDSVLTKYGSDLPSKGYLRKEFESYRKEAKLKITDKEKVA